MRLIKTHSAHYKYIENHTVSVATATIFTIRRWWPWPPKLSGSQYTYSLQSGFLFIVTCYPHKPSVADIPRKPSAIFELFLDVVAIEHLVKQTVTYAVLRGNHSFSLTSDEIKTFIGILLVR